MGRIKDVLSKIAEDSPDNLCDMKQDYYLTRDPKIKERIEKVERDMVHRAKVEPYRPAPGKTNRIYLDVPSDEEVIAVTDHDAKWDPQQHKWFVETYPGHGYEVADSEYLHFNSVETLQRMLDAAKQRMRGDSYYKTFHDEIEQALQKKLKGNHK